MYKARLAKRMLDDVAKEIGNGKIYYTALSRKLNKKFKAMKVRFFFESRPEMKLGDYLVINAFYHAPCRATRTHTMYSIHIGRDPANKMIKPRQHAFFRELYLVIAHELRHGYQYRRRNYRMPREDRAWFHHVNNTVREQVNYLTQYDELDAYAFETAEAMRLRNISDPDFGSLYWVAGLYYKYVRKHSFKDWKRFMKKVYKFSHK